MPQRKKQTICGKLFFGQSNQCIGVADTERFTDGRAHSLFFHTIRKMCTAFAGNFFAEDCFKENGFPNMLVTPFTTGIIHVKTVIPRTILEHFQTDELRTILLYEKMHIRLGHLWCYFLWDILCVLLWLNPYLMICRRFFKEDMEDICDKVTIQKSNNTAYEYGILLLKCIKLLCLENGELSAAFAGNKDFRDVKHRFVRIADFTPYKKIRVSVLGLCGMAVLMGLFLLVKQSSYPCYTEEHDIVLMNDAGYFWVLYDSEELRSAFHADGQNVFIDKKSMDQKTFKGRITNEGDKQRQGKVNRAKNE